MVRLALFISFLAVTAAPANSGAWLQEKGSVFFALSATRFPDAEDDTKRSASLFAEWGATPTLTLGLDIDEHEDLYGHALVFARFPIADLGKRGRFAAEFGIGAHHRNIRTWALYKVTLSYGKGFQNSWGTGWVNMDAALEYRTHDDLFRKFDITAGFFSQFWVNPLLQVETTYRPDEPVYWKARPSVMFRRPGGKTTWIVGVEHASRTSKNGVRFAVWRDF